MLPIAVVDCGPELGRVLRSAFLVIFLSFQNVVRIYHKGKLPWTGPRHVLKFCDPLVYLPERLLGVLKTSQLGLSEILFKRSPS